MSGISKTVIACTLAMAACTPKATPVEEHAELARPEAPTERKHLEPDGWGPLRIGMTRAEVVAAAGEDAHPEAVGGAEPGVCDQFRPIRAPDGLLVMIERDRLTRISVARNPAITTDRGFGVGSDAAAIAAAYGDAASRSPHAYLRGRAEYITVWATDPADDDRRGIVYEVGTDGRVTHVHAGGAGIEHVEGCL